MHLQHVLQSIYPRHLTCILIYPVNFSRIEVLAENTPMFLAQMGSQFHTDV